MREMEGESRTTKTHKRIVEGTQIGPFLRERKCYSGKGQQQARYRTATEMGQEADPDLPEEEKSGQEEK